MKHQFIEYDLISGVDKSEVIRVVNAKIAAGWSLYGSPSVQGPPFCFYAQAITRPIEYPQR